MEDHDWWLIAWAVFGAIALGFELGYGYSFFFG